MKVYVAMSGGVDSSVAAALLKKKGYEVTGVFFKPWQPDTGLAFCNWQKDRQDAMAVAEVLGIPFKTWDFSKEYKKKVGDYMIKSYRQGITPNPDVMCNKEIKFGLFLKKALKEGADFIATGHYVRSLNKNGVYILKKGKDQNKDQSYFLWTLTQEELKYSIFPVGSYTKQEVRRLAKKFNLPTFDKKDSQGVCFIGQLDMKEFLKKYIKPREGKIILRDSGEHTFCLGGATGIPQRATADFMATVAEPSMRRKKCSPPSPPEQIIGTHDGAAYYTIGQRHGLDITNGGGPYYVSGKNLKKNLVFVTKDQKKLGEKEITVGDINWIGSIKKTGIQIRARYRTPAVSAKVIHLHGHRVHGDHVRYLVKTTKPIRAVTPGQSVVFYRGQEMLGGGIISNS